MTTRTRRADRDTARPPGPRGAEAAGLLARMAGGRPLEACAGLFARYGDTVYLPVRPWPGLYILSRPEQAEHVLAASQDNYVKPMPARRWTRAAVRPAGGGQVWREARDLPCHGNCRRSVPRISSGDLRLRITKGTGDWGGHGSR